MEDQNRKIVVGGTYKHFKGNRYFVLAVGKHSETQEDLVVYLPLYVSDHTQVWVRPLSMFLEEIELDGKKIERFMLVK